MTTEQQNKMLDKFIGSQGQWESYKNSYGEECWGKYIPNYHHSDWNELMRVVEKILDLCLELDSMEMYYEITDSIPRIDLAHESCCKFVKWYNDENRDN
jgi:hypothetical protein